MEGGGVARGVGEEAGMDGLGAREGGRGVGRGRGEGEGRRRGGGNRT